MGKKRKGGQIITAVQGKGGVGKTTLLALLANEMTADGAKVAVIDTDPQGSAGDLLSAEDSGIDVAACTDEAQLGDIADHLKKDYDAVLIDTAGYKNAMAVYAVQGADLVLVPCGKSISDAKEAVTVWKHAAASLKVARSKAEIRIVLNHFKGQDAIHDAISTALASATAPVLSAFLKEINEISQFMTFRQQPKGPGRKAFRAVLAALQMDGLLWYYR